MTKRIGIVICNYNKKDMALECIEHILAQTYTDYALYVVDNASTDGSADAIRTAYDGKLTLLRNSENLGGSGGFNTGLRWAHGKGHPYLMCVDNDAMLDKDAVGELLHFLEEHGECGMAASKVYHLEEPEYVQNYGQRIDFEHFCTEVDDLNRLEDGSMPEYVYVDSVPACSLLVRRETVDRIGFLPEENFLYWDDTEWCLRCNRAGMKVASVGASKAYHAMGAKKEDVNTFPTYYAWRNWITFFIKYTPDERLVDMAMQFLSSVYEVQFVGWYNDVYRKADTVMGAYDDALHQVTGKAREGRIFEIDLPGQHYEDFFAQYSSVCIAKNGFYELAGHIRKLADRYGGTKTTVTLIASADGEDASDIGQADKTGSIAFLYLCRGFLHERIPDISIPSGHTALFWDVDDCIVPFTDQPGLQQDFIRGRELFIFSQLPMFLRQTRLIRSEL
ncbi:MAG: glycosyltransferase family 2 protein [Lachnospiraceae bacterium]|nr:glycosyltransferase family 2 protein [Lachnospiraceae bacterium]